MSINSRTSSSTASNSPRVDHEQWQSLRPVDLRIAIADACGFDFESTVVASGSNCLSAIYFRQPELVQIARSLGHTKPTSQTKAQLYFWIRQQIGTGASETYFRQEDLTSLAAELGLRPDSVERATLATACQQVSGSLLNSQHLYTLLDSLRADLIYAGQDCGRTYWPWRIQPVHEISETVVESADYVIVDSSIQDDEIGNSDTLDKAHELGADAAVLADQWHDVDGTVSSVLEGVDLYDDHGFDGQLVIPLQGPDYKRCFRALRNHGVSTDHLFALGGLKDSSPETQIAVARQIRELAGDDVHLHGLGFGVSDRLAAALADDPDLLDSIDTSTPIQNSIRETQSGEERLSEVAALAGARLIRDARKLSALVNEKSATATRLSDFN